MNNTEEILRKILLPLAGYLVLTGNATTIDYIDLGIGDGALLQP